MIMRTSDEPGGRAPRLTRYGRQARRRWRHPRRGKAQVVETSTTVRSAQGSLFLGAAGLAGAGAGAFGRAEHGLAEADGRRGDLGALIVGAEFECLLQAEHP